METEQISNQNGETVSKQNGVNGDVSASWFEQPDGKKEEQQVEDSDEEVVVLGD